MTDGWCKTEFVGMFVVVVECDVLVVCIISSWDEGLNDGDVVMVKLEAMMMDGAGRRHQDF